MESNAARAVRYVETLTRASTPDQVAPFFGPDIVFVEHPNRIVPRGRTRRLPELLAAFGHGRHLLRASRFDVTRVIEMGDEVAAEMEWTGVLAVPFQGLEPGHELKAFVGMFLTFREGRIVSQRNYDCYPPFAPEGGNGGA